MKQELENAIKECAKNAVREKISACEALQFTQAALNAVNAVNALMGISNLESK